LLQHWITALARRRSRANDHRARNNYVTEHEEHSTSFTQPVFLTKPSDAELVRAVKLHIIGRGGKRVSRETILRAAKRRK
jgi:hypothetical protein